MCSLWISPRTPGSSGRPATDPPPCRAMAPVRSPQAGSPNRLDRPAPSERRATWRRRCRPEPRPGGLAPWSTSVPLQRVRRGRSRAHRERHASLSGLPKARPGRARPLSRRRCPFSLGPKLPGPRRSRMTSPVPPTPGRGTRREMGRRRQTRP